MARMTSGGGWAAIRYTLRIANKVGWARLWHAMRSRNACKTCALGMGGQKGGMVNEAGAFPEVCKKSFQAMLADFQAGIPPEFWQRYSIAQLATLSPRELEWCGRLSQPVYAGPGDTHYRPISWDDAHGRVANQLRSTRPDETFFYASGRSSNEAGFLFQLLARLHGTNYVNNCSYYCHQASGVGLNQSLGTGTATVELDDLDKADLYVLIGGNPASNHPRLMTSLKNLRRRGGKVIVVNPLREIGLVSFRVPSDPVSLLFGTKIASTYIQPHIGGDIALMTGVAKRLIEWNAFDAAFVAGHCENFDEFRAEIARANWDDILAGSGVDLAAVDEFARVYAESKRAVFAWTMGVTHHLHGVDNVRMIVNLALMRGMVGKPGAGLMPIRGHSNVQGMGTIGVTPKLKQSILDNLERILKVELPKSPGLDTMACVSAAGRGDIKSAICLGGNLYGSNPDAAFAKRAIGNLDLIVYLNTSLNTGLVNGIAKHTLILPVCARDEESQLTTQESMFSYVRVSDGGKPRLPGPRPEVAILAAIGQRLFGDRGPIDWREMEQHASIRKLMSEVVPGLQGLADVDGAKREFAIPGRVLHEPKFATPSGKAEFAVVPVPRRDDGLRLMTIRSEGQFNTVVYEDGDIYRGQDRRDVILMNTDDMANLGVVEDQLVTVSSSAGTMTGIRARAFEVRAGNAAMYCPEANVLVPADVDPQSKTPAFKSVTIRVVPEARRPLTVV